MRPIACALALLFAACGDDAEPPTRVAPAAEAPPGVLQPVISVPAAEATLPATGSAQQLTARTTVRGIAEPRMRVVVATGCEAEACTAATRAAPDGAFEAEVELTAAAGRPVATIVVGYEDRAASVESDQVAVELREHVTPTPTPTPGPEPRTVVVIGDSLAVGMRPYLSEFLTGWQVLGNARGGRKLVEGMQRFAAASPPAGEFVSAFSLFTNDPPEHVIALESAVRRSTAIGCAAWATISGADAANARLEALAAASPERLQVVRWAERAEREPSWLKADGIHATPTGYRNRAALYATAIKRCA